MREENSVQVEQWGGGIRRGVPSVLAKVAGFGGRAQAGNVRRPVCVPGQWRALGAIYFAPPLALR